MGYLSSLALLLAVCAEGRKTYNTAAKYVTGAVNVHVVPHSHDDVGWLKTVDEYATGGNNSIQYANTGLTIDTVLQSLTENPDRRFIYVEQAFFERWLEEASDQQLTDMKVAVASGAMTFINGGYCMHDEAAPSYVDMVDQTQLGHRIIQETFGTNIVPQVTWQIDPFGHSATQAAFLSSPLAGYQGIFFGRIDYQDRAIRTNQSRLEFIWRASSNLGASAQTFTGVMNGYGPPNGLCWDASACGNTMPIQDDELLEDYNVDYFTALAVSAATGQVQFPSDANGTQHIMWYMGSDFQYTNARSWYKNLDKLIHYVNLNTSNSGVNLLYSTPAQYAAAKLAQAATVPLTLKTDDFFPYADGPHAMWTGYFTSRAALKGYVRDTSSVFQGAKQLQFMGAPPSGMGPTVNSLARLERAMGVTQHHDGVSGTSKQHVAYDYARRLAWGREDAQAANAVALAKLTGGFQGSYATCDLSNATICPPLESPVAGQAVLVLVYNIQGQESAPGNIRVSVGLPSTIKSYSVSDASGAAVPAQLIPASAADVALREDYYGVPSPSGVPPSFLAWQGPIPAMGFAAFFVTPTAAAEEAPLTFASTITPMRTSTRLGVKDSSITNGIITLTVDGSTGMISSFANAQTGVSVPLAQSFGWWNSSIGVDAPNDKSSDYTQPSGAYIFRPNSTTLFPVSAAPATVVLVQGPIINEVQQVVAGWLTQKVRLWAGAAHADFEFTIGPIPNPLPPAAFDPGVGKEVIARYSTNLATAATWYTDSNVREMQKRVRDFRPSWNYTVFESIAGNYYPVNARITTVDVNSGVTLSVTTDRSQGGSSMVDGSVELMIQRRLQQDDRRGVGEPLNETGINAQGSGLIVRGTHRVSIDTAATAAANGKAAVQGQMFRHQITYSPLAAAVTPAQWLASYTGNFTGLAAPLPTNVHLLTVHAQSPSAVIVRLAHLFEVGEDPVLSQPATVNLSALFSTAALEGCVELTTPASQPLSNVPINTVLIQGEGASTYPTLPAPPAGAQQTITLAPMEIRTFTCNYWGGGGGEGTARGHIGREGRREGGRTPH